MTDYGYVEMISFVWMVIGLLVFVAVPVALSIIWILTKKEHVTSILVGAISFILFALILEKPIQNVLLFPTVMGFSDHAISKFINSHPVLLAFMTGLFPGIFEETGRLIAYKTVLRKRKNKETSISYGIGHGGIEIIALLGLTYVNYIAYAVMINTGTFQNIVDQLMTQAPERIGQVGQMVTLLTTFSFGKLMLDVVERIFAVLFHIGASIMVFYACRDKGKFWLYPLAIVLHTSMDFFAGLVIFNVISISDWAMEFWVVIMGIAVFFGSFFLLYKKENKPVA